MKLLVIASLLAAAGTFARAADVPLTRNNFCPTGSITNTHNTIALNTQGQITYADECRIAELALINLYAQEAPKLPPELQTTEATAAQVAPYRITASVRKSTFAAKSQVLVCFPLRENIDATGPVHVYIQDNTFEQEAVIRFYGSYPRFSKLVISGNTLTGVSELSRYPTMATQVAGILGWQSAKDFYMREDSHIEISDNTVSVSNSVPNAAKKYEIRGIGIWNYVYMQKGCSVALNSNTISVKGVQGIFNGGMDAFAYIAEGPDTKYEMINNTINVNNGFAIGCPFARYPETEADEMRFSTNVLVTRNQGVINRANYFPTSKSDGDVIFVGNSKNSHNSTIEISHNTFEVKSSDANIRVAQTELLNTAQVKVVANTLLTTGGNPRIIFSWNMSAYDDSRVYALHNTLRRVDAFDFSPGTFFLYYRGFNLYNRSEAHLSQNTLRANSALAKAWLLDRLPEMPFYVHDDKSFKMCSNEYYSTVLNTDALMNGTTPEYCADYIASQEYCPAQPFPFPDLPDIPAKPEAFDPLKATNGAEATTTTTNPNPTNGGGETNQPAQANGCAIGGEGCTVAMMAGAAATAIAALLAL